jgi:hypothetical protein
MRALLFFLNIKLAIRMKTRAFLLARTQNCIAALERCGSKCVGLACTWIARNPAWKTGLMVNRFCHPHMLRDISVRCALWLLNAGEMSHIQKFRILLLVNSNKYYINKEFGGQCKSQVVFYPAKLCICCTYICTCCTCI